MDQFFSVVLVVVGVVIGFAALLEPLYQLGLKVLQYLHKLRQGPITTNQRQR
ncbi:MAG: hypothetical protein M3Q81_00560 [bacterium]|nr:hypothetical protein [bacterium]